MQDSWVRWVGTYQNCDFGGNCKIGRSLQKNVVPTEKHRKPVSLGERRGEEAGKQKRQEALVSWSTVGGEREKIFHSCVGGGPSLLDVERVTDTTLRPWNRVAFALNLVGPYTWTWYRKLACHRNYLCSIFGWWKDHTHVHPPMSVGISYRAVSFELRAVHDCCMCILACKWLNLTRFE